MLPWQTVLTSPDFFLMTYSKDQVSKNNPWDIWDLIRVFHLPWQQHSNRQEAGGGRPVVHVAICGCCSLRFLKFQSNLLPTEWPALHLRLVWNLYQVNILRRNRLKALFLLSFTAVASDLLFMPPTRTPFDGSLIILSLTCDPHPAVMVRPFL